MVKTALLAFVLCCTAWPASNNTVLDRLKEEYRDEDYLVYYALEYHRLYSGKNYQQMWDMLKRKFAENKFTTAGGTLSKVASIAEKAHGFSRNRGSVNLECSQTQGDASIILEVKRDAAYLLLLQRIRNLITQNLTNGNTDHPPTERLQQSAENMIVLCEALKDLENQQKFKKLLNAAQTFLGMNTPTNEDRETFMKACKNPPRVRKTKKGPASTRKRSAKKVPASTPKRSAVATFIPVNRGQQSTVPVLQPKSKYRRPDHEDRTGAQSDEELMEKEKAVVAFLAGWKQRQQP